MVTSRHSVEVRIRGQWVAVPVINVNGNELTAKGKWLKIARIRGEEMMEKGVDDPEVYIAALKKDPDRILMSDIFSFTQKVSESRPKFPYPIEWESVAAIPLKSFNGWWEGLPQESRKNVRRSQKRGVVIKVKEFDDELIEGIRQVNDDSPMRQGMRNAYYGLTSEQTSKRYGEFVGRCDFICAFFGEEMIGFLHLVYRDKVAAILNLTSKPSHFDKRPANALMAKAVEISETRGITHITYGLYNYGNKRDSPLREFKIRNGFVEVLVPRYFVPLTPWGKLCMKAKIHRGLIGTLPPSVIAAGLRARTMWYDLKTFNKPV
jgi:hypothetical protein